MSTGNLVIKKTRLKSKDPKCNEESKYFGGFIRLGSLGFAENWVYEKEAKLLPLREAEKLFFSFIAEDENTNYKFELLVK